MRWEEDHISHCSWVLRRCHPERSSCSGEFGWKSLFSTCHVKKLACFISHTSAEVHWTFHFQILYQRKRKNLPAKVSNSTVRTIQVCKLSRNVNFDGLTFLTALVLYSQSDYLNHSNRDSDWLIVTCLMRVWSMLTTLLFALEIEFVLKIESNSWGI